MVTKYDVSITASAAKAIRKVHPAVAKRLKAAILALGTDPRPEGVKKVAGREAYRVRVGDYRVIYTIVDSELVITVIRVGHRNDIYREKA